MAPRLISPLLEPKAVLKILIFLILFFLIDFFNLEILFLIGSKDKIFKFLNFLANRNEYIPQQDPISKK